MNIKIVAIGKIKENFSKEWIREFEKRLGAYCGFSIIEVCAEPILDDSLYEKYKKIEGERILAQIKSDDYVVTLEIGGKNFSSEDFAAKIKDVILSGVNETVFVIGGANGLSDEVSKRANLKLSLSKMTFTHQMARVILVEQIYRAFKIISGENYHR